MWIALYVLAFFLQISSAAYVIDAELGSTRIRMSWTTDYDEQAVLFSVALSSHRLDYMGVGFSDHGKYNNSDLCMLHPDGRLVDHYIDNEFLVHTDRSQDCELVKLSANELVFKRRFATCDPRDYAFEQGTTQFILTASIDQPLSMLDERVHKQIRYGKLINGEEEVVEQESDASSFSITADKLQVPSQVTTYHCIVQRMPEAVVHRKHHAIRMEAIVDVRNKDLVHHMEIFHCESQQTETFEGECSSSMRPRESKSCSRVIAAWAMGEGPVIYPSEAGLPVGGLDTVPYIMVEIHYNNEAQVEGRIDNSGFKFTVTPTLRKYDAAIMELGLIYSDANSIPPRQREFPISGYCAQECTRNVGEIYVIKLDLPEGGINIFGSQLHAHLTGRKLYTSQFRKGVKVGEINRDNHYSPHWQHIQPIRPPINVQPGDVLETTCVYETLQRSKVTLGGYGIEDEMCVNYIYYYPASDVEVCKSAVNNATLHRFFSLHGVRSKRLSISKKYNSIPWTSDKVEDLHEMFVVSNLNMHCLGHDGEQLESSRVDWTSVPHPRPLSGPFSKMIDATQCPAIND